jgi:hypothetical protein
VELYFYLGLCVSILDTMSSFGNAKQRICLGHEVQEHSGLGLNASAPTSYIVDAKRLIFVLPTCIGTGLPLSVSTAVFAVLL